MLRKTLTILFADVQDYTSRTGRQSREQQEQFILELQSFIKEQVKEKNGNFVKSMGDGFLVTFESPTDAVACGKSIQKQISIKNANTLNQENLVRFRIGISTGEVMVDDNGDVYGEAVNIAARIEKFATPNEVYISESTYLSMNKSEFNALDLGPQKFKNLVQEIRVYRIFEGKGDIVTNLQRPIRKKYIQIASAAAGIITMAYLIFLFTGNPLQDTRIPAEDEIHAEFERMLREKNYHGIIDMADKLLKEHPHRHELYAISGEAFMLLGDLERAKYYLLKAIELDPENIGAYHMLSDLHAQQHEYDEAISWLAEYLKREQDSIEKRIAIKRMQELELLKKEYYSTRRKEHEKDILALRSPGSGQQPFEQQQQNNPPQQINRKNINRQRFQEISEQIRGYMRENDYAPVREILESNEEENAENPRFLIFSSKIYSRMNDYGKAEELLIRAIDLTPDNPLAYFELSMVYENMGNYRASINTLEKFIDIEQNETRRRKAKRRLKFLKRRLR